MPLKYMAAANVKGSAENSSKACHGISPSFGPSGTWYRIMPPTSVSIASFGDYLRRMACCNIIRDRDIVFQSYSSLAQDRLTGKYSPKNEPRKTYRFSSYPMKDLEPTLKVLRGTANARSISINSVALNYDLSKGVVPPVGIRTQSRRTRT